MPKIAVLTATRDRLDYTKHCFGTLHENAGCSFDHYVFDNGSRDETPAWLNEYCDIEPILSEYNLGISRAMNALLDAAGAEYDVYVTFDNDCEVTMDGTLATAARVAAEGDWIVSPVVLGLMHPPGPGEPVEVAGERIGPYPAIGGIFRTMPGSFARTFRFDERNPTWGMDERNAGGAASEKGIGMGYLLDWTVNHYRTTVQQNADYPEYWDRKQREMGMIS